LDAKDLVLKLLDDVKLLDPCKPYADVVAKEMWVQVEHYLDKIVPNCVAVGKDILYAYFVVGSVLRNTIAEYLEYERQLEQQEIEAQYRAEQEERQRAEFEAEQIDRAKDESEENYIY
jgi:glycerol-3-phosphate cytidylyltransferase-like family protein